MNDTKRFAFHLPDSGDIRMNLFTDWEGTDLHEHSHYCLQLTFTGVTADMPPALTHAVELYGLSCHTAPNPPLCLTVAGKRSDVLGFTKALPACSPLPFRLERIVSYCPKNRTD